MPGFFLNNSSNVKAKLSVFTRSDFACMYVKQLRIIFDTEMKNVARWMMCNRTLCLGNAFLHSPHLFAFIFMLHDYTCITFSVNVSILTEGYALTFNLGFSLITFTVSTFSYHWK